MSINLLCRFIKLRPPVSYLDQILFKTFHFNSLRLLDNGLICDNCLAKWIGKNKSKCNFLFRNFVVRIFISINWHFFFFFPSFSDVCWLRLDFETFQTLGPTTTTELSGGACLDTFTMTVFLFKLFKLLSVYLGD